MPVTSLESYINENRLAGTAALDCFRNAVIGIDVSHYINKIYENKNEPLVLGVGGLLEVLKHTIEADLSVLGEYSILPLFVFHGLSIDGKVKKLKAKDLSSRESLFDSSWPKHSSMLSSPNIQDSRHPQTSIRKSLDDLYPFIVNDLIHFFIASSVDYFVSPYNASFQLSYFQEIGLIDAIMGSTDLILTKTERFIQRFDFQTKEVKIIDKARLLADLNLSERQLIDLSIIVGCAVQPTTFPHLPQNSIVLAHQPSTVFRAALEYIHQYLSFPAVNSSNLLGYVYGLHDQSLVELYLRGIAACEFMPILTTNGEVSPYLTELNKLKLPGKETYLQLSPLPEVLKAPDAPDSAKFAIPNDVHVVISQRLPLEFFFYSSIGMLPLNILESITTGFLHLRPPSNGSSCDRYKQLISSEKSKLIMDMQFNILTQLLTRYYQVKKIEVSFWFQDNTFQLNTRLIPPISSRFTNLQGLYSGDSHFSFRQFWHLFPGTKSPENSDGPLTNGDLIMNALCRSLFVSGLIDTSMQESKVIQIFKLFVESLPLVSDAALLSLFVLLCFLHEEGVDVLFKTEAVPSNSQESKANKELLDLDVNGRLRAVSRVVSLVKVSFPNGVHHGPASKDLLTFGTCIEVLRERLLVSLQVSLVDFVAKKEDIKLSIKSKREWAQLVLEIPFYKQLNNPLMGVVCESFFKTAIHKQMEGDSLEKAATEAETHVQTVFNIKEDISKFLGESLVFWKAFVLLMELAHESDAGFITKEHLALIGKCSEILEQFCPNQ